MTLTDELRKLAIGAGFVTVGITTTEKLHGLPHGWVHTVQNLQTPEEVLPTVKSVMLLGYYEYLTIDSWAINMVSQEFFNGDSIGPEQVKTVFEPWGKWKGLAYWLWDWSDV